MQAYMMHLLLLLLGHTAGATKLSAPYTNISSVGSGPASTAIGDYVAAGLNLDKQSASQTLATAITHYTLRPSGTSTGSSTSGYDNTTLGDTCWAQWSSYWSSSTKVWASYTTFRTIYDHTQYSVFSVPPTTSTDVVTTTETAFNGNFATKTFVTTITSVETVVQSISTTDWLTTEITSARYTVTPSLTAPPCMLPSYVPQCQSSWASWGSHGAVEGLEPRCTQATVTGSLCTTVLSKWLHQQQVNMVGQNLGEIEGKVGLQPLPHMSNGTQLYPNSTQSWYWPSTSKIAPGCSVGCQSCRVSGSNVKLLFWPPATSTYRNGSIVTAKPNKTGIVTAVAAGTTLTSPTVYISFDEIHGSNSCSVIGKTLSNVIVAITNTASLNSLWGWDRYWGLQSTASFNFTDLYVTPVPSSLYMSQPRCASSSISIQYSCLPYASASNEPQICIDARLSGKYCATTLPYEPVISVPHEVQQLQPEWAGCIGGLMGVYDPPSALRAAVSAAGITLPHESTAVKTTSQAEVAPTTQAAPSPTASRAAPATNVPLSSQAPQPVQSSKGPAIVASSTLQDSGPSQPTSNNQQDSEPSSSNALDVLTQAESAPAQQSNASPEEVSAPNGPSQAAWSPDAAPSAGGPSSNGPSGGQASFSFDPVTSAAAKADPTDAIAPALSVISSAQGENQAASSAQAPQNTAVAVGSNVVVVNPSTTAVIQPGNTQIIGSQTFAAGPSGIEVDGSSASLFGSIAAPTASSDGGAPAAVWTASSQEVTAHLESSGIVLAGPGATATIVQGSVATFAGQTISVDKTGSAIQVDGTAIALTSQAAETHFSYAPESLTGLEIADTTLLPGFVATISGTTYSLPSAGSSDEIAIYINGQSTTYGSRLTLSGNLIATPTILQSLPAFMPSSSSYSKPTLTPGSALTISGTTYSLPTWASIHEIFINGKLTTPFPSDILATPTPTPTLPNASLFTFSGTQELVIGSQTLTPGGLAISVSGTMYSAQATGGGVVVKGSETTYTTALSEFGGGENGTMSGTSVSTSTTTAARNQGPSAAPSGEISKSGAGELKMAHGLLLGSSVLLYAVHELVIPM